MNTPILNGIRKLAAMETDEIKPIFYLVTGRFTNEDGSNTGVRIEPFYQGDSSLNKRDQFDLCLQAILSLQEKGKIFWTLKNERLGSLTLGAQISPFPKNGKIWMRSKGNSNLEDNINHLPILN